METENSSARVRSFRAHPKFVIFSYCQPGHLLNELAKLIEELWTRLAIVKLRKNLTRLLLRLPTCPFTRLTVERFARVTVYCLTCVLPHPFAASHVYFLTRLLPHLRTVSPVYCVTRLVPHPFTPSPVYCLTRLPTLPSTAAALCLPSRGHY